MHHDRHIIINATRHVHNFINASVIASMHCIIDLLACWHFNNTFFSLKININSIKIKATLSKNVWRTSCLCHIIRSRVKNASSGSRVDPIVFHATHVPVQLFDYIRIRSSGVTIPRMKTRGTLKVSKPIFFRVFLISLQGTHTFLSNFTHPNLGTRFFLRGVGCDTPGV